MRPVTRMSSTKPATSLFVVVGLCVVGGFRRAISHRVPAWVHGARLLLEVVPVLHNLSVLESEDVKADLGRKVVVGVCEHVVAILEHADRVHAGRSLGELSQQCAEPCEAITRAEVVLDVLPRMIERIGPGSPLSML